MPSVTILFWLFTYVLLSFNVKMVWGDSFDLFSIRRMLATTAGAAVFAFVLAEINKRNDSRPVVPLHALATIVPAALVVLGARWVIDLVYQQPVPVAFHMTWVLVWAGYFGLWISVILALQLHEANQRKSVQEQAMRYVAPPLPSSTVSPVLEAPSPDAMEWVVDAIASEFGATSQLDRAELIKRLIDRAGYEIADERDPSYHTQNARVELVQRLERKMKQQGAGMASRF